MSLLEFCDAFCEDFPKSVKFGLGNEPMIPGYLFMKVHTILTDVVEYGRVGVYGKSPLDGERGICEFLAVAGYLRREGEAEVVPTHYTPTSKAFEIMDMPYEESS
jgi:hypothetical protein